MGGSGSLWWALSGHFISQVIRGPVTVLGLVLGSDKSGTCISRFSETNLRLAGLMITELGSTRFSLERSLSTHRGSCAGTQADAGKRGNNSV